MKRALVKGPYKGNQLHHNETGCRRDGPYAATSFSRSAHESALSVEPLPMMMHVHGRPAVSKYGRV